MSKLILPQIGNALTSFVKSEEVAEVLSLGLTMNKPVLLYGRGGHGKSEMVRSVFYALAEAENDIFVQSFGEGMTEAKLFGGLDLKRLNCPEKPVMVFNPEDSFLNSRYAMFEELFDAPPVVLLSLKDTLMDKRLNNGAQSFKMRTELLVAATNKDPSEISELGPSAHALTERFPLQLCVEWETYTDKDFLELFEKVDAVALPKIFASAEIKGILASLIAEAHENGEWISPRQAVVCLETTRAAAIIAGRKEVHEDDFESLWYIPGTGGVLEKMEESIKRLKEVNEAQNRLTQLTSKVNWEESQINGGGLSPIKLLQAAKRLKGYEKEVSNLKVPDALTDERKKLGSKVSTLISKAQQEALESTHL